MTRILIVDDEELARQRMRRLLGELAIRSPVIDEASDGENALERIRAHPPDLLLLDIQMPVLDGFDVVDLMPEPRPPVIFVTAFDEYALRAFDVHALDYLLKPVRKARLRRSLERLQDPTFVTDQHASLKRLLRERHQQFGGLPDKLPVDYKQDILMLDLDGIFYFEADGKLTWAHTNNRRYRTSFRLHELEERLKGHAFFRIHRSCIVNLGQIEKLEPWFKGGLRLKLKNGAALEVARRRLGALKERLGIR